MPEATADSETIRRIQATINAIESREWLRETNQLTESVDPLRSLKKLTDPIVHYAYTYQLSPRVLCEYLRTGEQRLFDGALDVLHRIAADVRYRDAHEDTSPVQGEDRGQAQAGQGGPEPEPQLSLAAPKKVIADALGYERREFDLKHPGTLQKDSNQRWRVKLSMFGDADRNKIRRGIDDWTDRRQKKPEK